MNAKTKKILSAIAVVVVLAILGITWLSNGKQKNNPSSEETGLIVESISETETNKETETEPESSTEPETTTEAETSTEAESTEAELKVKKNGQYSDKDRVALYIHTYGCLPQNYITKEEAEDLGWSSSKGNLWKVANGKSIGGDYFGNYEGKLPKKSGRKYYECDIDYRGGYRNEKRIIFSNDGLVFYTDDHYESFEQLY